MNVFPPFSGPIPIVVDKCAIGCRRVIAEERVILHLILSSYYGHSVTRCAFTVDVDGRNIKGGSIADNEIGHIK